MTTTTPPRATANRTAEIFRRLVTLSLRAAGLDVDARATTRSLADSMLAERSHIRGLKQFCVLTDTTRPREISRSLDAAQRAAEDDGKAYAAVVTHRPGRDVSESYVTMPFADWVEMLRELETER